jgi:hypothetical protein
MASGEAEKAIAAVVDKIQKVLVVVALAIGIVFGILAGVRVLSDDGGILSLPTADVPPLEYVYLDSARVLAYLGQIEQGLATTESRTFTEKRTRSSAVKGEGVIEVSDDVQRQRETQQVVTQSEADRFFTFLRILRGDGNPRPLTDIDVQLTRSNSFASLRSRLKRLREGDFVRIRGAQLSLPPFAAVYPRVRYLPYYSGGELQPPKQPLYAPLSEDERKDMVDYRARLGENPRLPFVVPTLAPDQRRTTGAKVSDRLSFIIPVKYAGLTLESGLLAGTVTIVGKVVYRDPRLPSEVSDDDAVRPHYIDRQALASFGQALKKAPRSLLDDLDLSRGELANKLRRALTISAPVVLVLPLAIYQ